MSIDREATIKFLQEAWKEVTGDVRQFAAEIVNKLHQVSADDYTLIIQLALSIVQMPFSGPKNGILWAESIVSGSTKDPFVVLTFGAERIQFTPVDARQHATQVLFAAEAAEMDSLLVKYFSGKIGMADQYLVEVLNDFRTMRKAKIQ